MEDTQKILAFASVATWEEVAARTAAMREAMASGQGHKLSLPDLTPAKQAVADALTEAGFTVGKVYSNSNPAVSFTGTPDQFRASFGVNPIETPDGWMWNETPAFSDKLQQTGLKQIITQPTLTLGAEASATHVDRANTPRSGEMTR